MAIHLAFWKRIISWIVPVNLDKKTTSKHPILYLKYYQGQLILATPSAFYSYGAMYLPYRKMFHEIQKELPRVKSFLMLGTGLGSALKILQTKHHCYPASDLVEWDEEIIAWSVSEMNLNTQHNVQWIAEDAEQFVQQTNKTYDLIALDLFRDTEIPAQFKTASFFKACRHLLQPKGMLCINIIPAYPQEEKELTKELGKLFESIQELVYARNVFLICRT